MRPILLRVPRHPYRWGVLLLVQQVLLVIAATSGNPLVWMMALAAVIPVLTRRLRPSELLLRLDPEERVLTVGEDRRPLASASSVRVGLRFLGRVEIEDPHGNTLVTLAGLSLPHAHWVARQLSEHFSLELEATHATASSPVQAPLADGFLEKVLDVPILHDLTGRLVMAGAVMAIWSTRIDEGPVVLAACALSLVFAVALGLVRGRRSHRVKFTADRVESVWTDVLNRSHRTVLQASELLSAEVVPGLGASPTLILADRHGDRIELTQIDRGDLLDVVACVERMRSEVRAIPETPPEPEDLRRLRTARLLER